MKKDIEKLKKELPDIKKDILLSEHTTFKIGGKAEYFLLATKEKEIIHSIKIAKKFKIPVFVMGGGSNLLVSDKLIKGLVVKNQVKEPIVLMKNNIIKAPGGIVFGKLVNYTINKSLEGLSWAGGLPGTFGGAIRGNAGAFGGEIKDSVLKVRALDNKLNLKELTNKQCKFSYRSSIFKQKNWVVLSALVKLKKGDKKKIQEISDSHINYRKERHPLEYPNAGSIFKNVDFKKVPIKFKKLFSDKVKKDPFEIVPTAWFIIGAGLVGKKIGGAQVSKKHSNYIVNLGGASARDVVKLINLIKQKVKKKYNINLETEIQFIGF